MKKLLLIVFACGIGLTACQSNEPTTTEPTHDASRIDQSTPVEETPPADNSATAPNNGGTKGGGGKADVPTVLPNDGGAKPDGNTSARGESVNGGKEGNVRDVTNTDLRKDQVEDQKKRGHGVPK